MGISYELATDMARVWPEVGISLKTLIEKINNVRNEEEERAVAAELRFIVKKKEPTYPAR
jgi:division protein CdvB (Snf7/Vps24/ESCRT-III family)